MMSLEVITSPLKTSIFKPLIVFLAINIIIIAQESRDIYRNQSLNTSIDSERMLLLDRLMIETGMMFPVYSRPITIKEWRNYIFEMLKKKSDLINPHTLSRLKQFIPDYEYKDPWHYELYGRGELETIIPTADKRFFITRYEERQPSLRLNLEASVDTSIGLLIGVTTNNYWPVYEHTNNKTNLPENIWEDTDFRVFNKAYFSYQSPGGRITFQFGRDNLKWGLGKNSTLFVSDNVAYFDFIKFVLWFDNAKFSMLYSTLTDYEPQFAGSKSYYDVSYLNKQPKSMLLQRIEWSIFKQVNLGMSYMKIIYGRYPVLGDINPLIYQHNLFKEYQNSLTSFDISISPFAGFNLYGELSSDEVSFSDDPKKDNPNDPSAISYQFGFNAYISGFYANLEYVFVAPYMYNHKHFLGRAIEVDGVRYYKTSDRELKYTALGHWIPPDSRAIFFSLDKSLSEYWVASLFAQLINHGSINILTEFPQKNYIHENSPTGIVEKTRVIGLKNVFQNDHFIIRNKILRFNIKNYKNVPNNFLNGWEIQLSFGYKFELF
ncbi:MAG: capsule assembly Wzi family protein [Bacteroidetes bacterium]|nr:capsule assembly Wzi family protein [Bacteroidota bacterium]